MNWEQNRLILPRDVGVEDFFADVYLRVRLNLKAGRNK
jgi:hypothetical protein